MTRFAFENTFR